ncbi:hypothetical protein GE118_00910 [Mycoplasma sp. NEAQ87857]|uniref:nuclease-related domain-containing protein n=1 Tax=Mycoplasma sp. NEAQ87857 TaxID=2683967 RepID=UPI0013191164|nr:nuclease-related domain-containing protein [Mycoplasma sp. NEAQ87857]QGZ97362.1 hypothetical protein GE118_00910 [Mycoplasma sp. NEAQ87857]
MILSLIKSASKESSIILPTNDITIIMLVVYSLILVILIALAIWRFFFKIKNDKSVGFLFEKFVQEIIEKEIKNKNIIYIPGGVCSFKSKMFEFDGLLVTQSMIAVLEYKAYDGTISGESQNEFLTLSSGKHKKIKVKNPILQNEKHIQHIYDVIGEEIPTASIIVFADTTIIDIKNSETHVRLTNIKDIRNEINLIINESQKFLPVVNIQKIEDIFSVIKIKNKKEMKKFKKIIGKNNDNRRSSKINKY